MDIDKVLNIINKYKEYIEVRAEKIDYSLITYENKELKVKTNSIFGYMVRVYKNGYGYVWGRENLEELIKKAIKIAESKKDIKLEHSRNVDFVSNTKKFPDLEEKVSLVKENFYTKEKINSLKLTLYDWKKEKWFLNNEGANIYQSSTRVYFSSLAVAKSLDVQTSYERKSSFGYDFDFLPVVEASQKNAIALLSAETIPKGNYRVILDPKMAGLFTHEAVGHATEADSVLEGDSVFAGKIGEKVGNERVNIIDDPTYLGFGNYVYDDEGFKAKKTQLIEKGILKNYLHNSYTSKTMGLPNNGHARAESIKSPPIVRMSNTMFLPLNEDPFEGDGVYVVGTKGGSVDTFNGNFMFSAERAYLIKNGEKEKLLKNVSISGNIFEALNRIEAVGENLELDPGFCGKNSQSVPVSDGGPAIRISLIRIA